MSWDCVQFQRAEVVVHLVTASDILNGVRNLNFTCIYVINVLPRKFRYKISMLLKHVDECIACGGSILLNQLTASHGAFVPEPNVGACKLICTVICNQQHLYHGRVTCVLQCDRVEIPALIAMEH
jgi:hypothetical protein